MAERDADEVAQILSRGYQSVIANRQFQQEQAERVREAQANEQARKDQLAQQQSQFEATQAASEKLFKLGQARDEFNQAMQSVPYGITPPGMVEAPVGPNAPPPDQRMRYLIGPSGQTAAIPSVGMYQTQQKAQAQAASDIELKREQDLQAQRQVDLANQMATQHGFDLETAHNLELARIDEMNNQKRWDDERARLTINGENSRAQKERETMLRVAMINATGGLSEMMRNQGNGAGGLSITTGPDGAPQFNLPKGAENVNNSLGQLYNGTNTLDEIEKVNPKQKQMISSLAGMANVDSLTPDVKKDLQDQQLLKQFADRLYDLNIIRQQGALADWAKFNADKASLVKDLPGVISRLNNVKRANTVELQKELEGLIPSRVPWSTADAEGGKYNTFAKQILDRSKADVQGIRNQGQQDSILNTYEMNKLRRLKLSNEQGANPPTQQRKVVRWVPDPRTGQLVPQTGGQ